MQCSISSNAMKILETRYLDGESVDSMWDRVSGGNQRFRDLLSSLRFLPNSPTLFNAGRNNGCTLSACFVFNVTDTMFGKHSITETREKAIAVAKAGGGVGYYFGDIRPKGSPIKSIHRVACGPVAVLRDYHQIHKLITQGGKRDLAQMGVLPCFHQDIREFIHCKDEDPQSLSSFNISVDWRDDWIKKAFQQMDENKPGKELNLWNEQVESAWKHGCPGMLFSDTVNRFNPNIHLGRINATNPCLVGDTLVATADGRRGVTIKELADKGDDVPVYCLNNDGEIVIRIMRHPRLTGVRQPIIKVHLDNGQCVRVTKNHKLLLTDGRYVEAQYLEAGDSLSVMTRYRPKPDNDSSASRAYRYLSMQAKGNTYYEHMLIAEHFYGQLVEKEDNVHHKNGDRFDNRPENLEVINTSDHMKLHSKEESNSNWSGVTNEELLNYGKMLTRSLGRRFSRRDWESFARDNGLPTSFSKWREQSFGTLLTFAKKCAVLEGLNDYADKNPKIVKVYQKAIEYGLDAEIVGNKVIIRKKCEVCGDEFTTLFNKRERCLCSTSCYNRQRDMTQVKKSIKEKSKRKQIIVRFKQVQVFNELKKELSREPSKKEWIAACKRRGVSAECSRKSSPFPTWDELVEYANNFNHKVLCVEEDGYEDVYNGTVDEFHNFYIGEWDEGLTKKDLRCIRYINTLNCGETPNRNAEPCSLGSLSLPRYFNKHNRDINWNLLEEDVWTALEFMDDILDRNEFPHPDITEAALLTRKLGLGVMGWADLLALMHIHYDTEKAVNLGRELMKFINTIALDRSAELARTKGPYKGYSDLTDGPCVRNETRTSIAPTGTIAIIANVWGSIEPHFALSWDRTTNEGIKLKERISCWDDLDGFVPKIANDIAPEWHVRHQAAFQSEVNLGVSKTVNLPNSATKEDVSRIYRMMYESGCKGGTVYRDGCRNEQVLVSEKTKSVFSLSNGSVKKKKKLPPERSSITHKFKVSGTDFFLTVGLFENGEPGEIFVRASRLGSTICGMLDSWAITFSIALQNGTPLETLCRHHLGTRFEPSGMTDNKEIPICMSIPDYIVRWLDMKFITKSGDKPKGIDSGIYCPECGREAIYQAGCLNCTDRNCGWTKCG